MKTKAWGSKEIMDHPGVQLQRLELLPVLTAGGAAGEKGAADAVESGGPQSHTVHVTRELLTCLETLQENKKIRNQTNFKGPL